MPIFVQWEWQERTSSFLCIFHFFDDRSMTNLRMKTAITKKIHLVPSNHVYSEKHKLKEIMSWAPSHPQLGLLTELLTYANLINGLKYEEKTKLRNELEGKK